MNSIKGLNKELVLKTKETLSYRQDAVVIHVNLPKKPSEEIAYVLKLSFTDKIPDLKMSN